ncbi:MAG: tRNA 2-thiouridine(34) synthase MnmA [Chloroflexota bacterium]
MRPNEQNKPRVVVAMSGGVDSSVAAALLVEQGYDVVGLMMRLWSEPGIGPDAPANRCCTPDQMADARRVANMLGIPFYVIDSQTVFRKKIVQFFIDEHEKGRTPNPCIECNREIRFTYLLEYAMALDAQFLATGHYVQVMAENGRYHIRKGVDEKKDQSYVLHMLTQEKLGHVLFPIGGYTKPQVRELAANFGLPVASKSESQDLCFLGDGNYRRFLSDHGQKVDQPGPIITMDGAVLGQHKGLSSYTIGQRKGLGITTPEPVFVISKEAQTNTLRVGPRSVLGKQTVWVRDVNWVSGTVPNTAIDVEIKIRYKAKPILGSVEMREDGRALAHFFEPAFGVTPGQGAVFYVDDECIGGGIIDDLSADEQLIPIEVAISVG